MINHARFKNLGEWISLEYGDQGGLAETLKPKVAKNTVSSWKTGKNGIPPDYQKQLRKLGYDGPWPREEIQEPASPAGGPYITEKDAARELGKLEGRIETLEKRLEEALEQLRDLYLRGPKESRPQEPPQ